MDNNLREQDYMMREEEISLMDYVRIIFQYISLIIGIFVFVATITVIYTFTAPKIYQATSKVLLEDKSAPGMDFMLYTTGGGRTSINNNIEILKSRPVATLGFQLMQKYPDYDLFPIMKKAEESDIYDPVSSLVKNLKVESKRDTDILTLSFESTSPAEAMIVVNSMAEALFQQTTQVARTEYTNIREFLESQLDAISRRLQNSEEELRNYKIESGTFLLSEETRKLIEKSADAGARLQEAQAQQEIAQNSRDYLIEELSKQDTLLVDVSMAISTAYIDKLRDDLVRNKTKIMTLINNNDYPEDHPEIVKLNTTLENAKKRLSDELEKALSVRSGSSDIMGYRNTLTTKIAQADIDLNVATATVNGYQVIVDDYNRKMSVLPDTELELARLQRNYQIDERIHLLLTEKYEDAKVAEQAKMGNIRIIDRAVMPTTPIKPNKKMNLLIGFVLGIGLGIGAAMVLNSMDTKIRTLDDVERFVKVPVFGTIPYMSTSDNEDAQEVSEKSGEELVVLSDAQTKVSVRLISHYAPKSPVAEAYRTLRTNVLAKKVQGPVSIEITSSGASEGKTTTLANLAITLAQMKSTVCLVDFDLRRPMVHNVFELERNNGSSDFLGDESVNIDSIIKPSGIENLSIITSGAIPPNPSELIASDRADLMIKKLKERYDYVLFDTPPVIAVTDSMIMAKKVDMLILVIRVNYTEKGVVQRTKTMLENINITISGIVVNGIVHEKYYRGYSYYYYYYYYYYGESTKKKKNGIFSRFLRKS
ncbi:MAG: polysaccharide biosynthesis tyrosine autokinase [Candidatus Cloacimonadales bacterium]|jgi:tyrosine-protein kinase Etk/Wzc|nr:polysaccharide biosynthesis tyrosine autokinase [Candidatus Cloacimonadales bacterium]